MPWHVAIDQASERRLGKLQIGTTKRGVGPAYADKASRIGIRVQDVLDPKILRQKIEVALAEKNLWLERIYDVEPFDLEEVASRYEVYAAAPAPARRRHVAASSTTRCARDSDVLFEGAQATLLDLDHGTYPFVTSSNPTAAGAAIGAGIGPTRIDTVIGVAKAYVTRVGEGPFPSEIDEPRADAHARARRRVRHRHGRGSPLRLARPRRAALRGARQRARPARAHEARRPLALRRDSRLRALPAAATGRRREHFPAHQSDFHAARPVYETLSGWGDGSRQCGSVEDLPEAAGAYVDFVERELDVAVTLVGTGAERESVLTR